MPFRRIGSASIAVALLSTVVAGQQAQPALPRQVELLGVNSSHGTEDADARLIEILGQALEDARLGVTLGYNPFANYGAEIENVTTRRDSTYIARMTPYAFLTAVLLGSDLEVLATYRSVATGKHTYRSYFVVNAQRFHDVLAQKHLQDAGASSGAVKRGEAEPTLDALRDYLRGVPRPAFVYHDQFSTSSYFLPALWLRGQLFFDMPESSKSLTAIEARYRKNTSARDSVIAVARGDADLAAVWDGTKTDLERERPEDFGKVLFIPLPDELPNDLLVCPTGLHAPIKKAVVAAIGNMKDNAIGKGDFISWIPIQKAADARYALANLRQLATAPPAPVVVDIDAPDEALRSALRKAVQLANPEFVLRDPDFHARWDVQWSLAGIHDGAVRFSTTMQEPRLKEFDQQFFVSYVNANDLTGRIMALIRTRMHRMRYVWPYQEVAPTILGDVDFTVGNGSRVPVERFEWADPRRNDFAKSRLFWTSIRQAADAPDPHNVALNMDEFRVGGEADFHNPLSNVAYRAMLVRPSYESMPSKAGTATLLFALVVLGMGAGFDLRRRAPRGEPPAPHLPSLEQEYLTMATAIHTSWCKPLSDAAVLWCDRRQIEEKIEELKTRNLVPMEIGGRQRRQRGWSIGGKLPLLQGLVTASADTSVYDDLTIDPSKVGDTVRLGALLRLLVDKQLLSTFAGRPLEWDAMNGVVARVIGGGEMVDDAVLEPGDETIVQLASKHFERVLENALHNLSLFQGTWRLVKRDDRTVAVSVTPLPGALAVGRERERVRTLTLEFDVPPQASLLRGDGEGQATCACWIVGTLLKISVVVVDGEPGLCLRFGALALLDDVEASSIVVH